jgi:hypothetical protein
MVNRFAFRSGRSRRIAQMPDVFNRMWPTLVLGAAAILSLAGCSGTTVSVPLSDGRVATLSSYRLWVATAASIDVTDPETGATVSGSYSSDPQAQQASDALGLAARALQLAAPGP